MPYRTEWVDAELFVERNGVRVFHTYEDDDVESGRRRNYFTLDPAGGEGDPHFFDVRELSNWTEPPHPPFMGHDTPENRTPENEAAWKKYHEDSVEEKHIRAIVLAAIESGDLKKPDGVDYD